MAQGSHRCTLFGFTLKTHQSESVDAISKGTNTDQLPNRPPAPPSDGQAKRKNTATTAKTPRTSEWKSAACSMPSHGLGPWPKIPRAIMPLSHGMAMALGHGPGKMNLGQDLVQGPGLRPWVTAFCPWSWTTGQSSVQFTRHAMQWLESKHGTQRRRKRPLPSPTIHQVEQQRAKT